jgi:serine/threonine-protein kinase
MGAVYEVVHVNTGEHLALKLMLSRSLLTPELVERFRREARVSSSVKSEHVVRVIDADVASELDDAPYLVMELLEGQDLERLCLDRRPSDGEVVEWMRQMAVALDKAHAEGIVHRDLKPENVFLAARDELPAVIKILDFGVAKMAEDGAGVSTATGQILGTPRYMAPEQAAAAKEVSAAADRCALGLIAFRLLSGRHYFLGENWIALLREVARGPGARPSELGCDRGRAFDAWFAKACARDPRARFATCAEQVDALVQALAGAAAGGAFRRIPRAAVLLASVAAVAALGWRLSRRHAEAVALPPAAAMAQPQRAVESRPPPPPVPEQAPPVAAPVLPEASIVERPLKRPAARPAARARAAAKKTAAPEDRIWNEP